MTLYAAIDLHSNNELLSVIDAQFRAPLRERA